MSDENKIIGLDGKPAAEAVAAAEETQVPARPRLTPQNFAKIAGAFDTLEQLAVQKVATPTQAAEITGLKKFLLESFLVFGPELLGCYDAVRNEYEPLLKSFSVITNRVASILAGVQAQQAARAAKAASETKPEAKP